jgi:hypothetical protein
MYRKLIVSALGISAIAAAGLLILDTGGPQDRDLLRHVPADTVFYNGYSDPNLPLAELVDMWGPMGKMSRQQAQAIDPSAATEQAGPAGGVMAGLYKQYLISMAEDEYPLKRFGISRENVAATYAVGALPVMRVSLGDPEAFWQRLDAIEETAGVDAANGKQRRYAFDTESDQRQLDLLVTSNDGYAILTLAGSGIDDSAIDLAVGASRPETSLDDSGRLDELAQRHGTLPAATGFLDHQALAAGLTGASDDRFASMLAQLVTTWGGDDAGLGAIRNNACQQDFATIAEQWPYTSVGITRLDTNTRELGTRVSMAVPDDGLRSKLTGLRGHIPDPVDKRPIAGLGLGLRGDSFASTVQDLARAFTGSDFQCKPLQQAQRQLRNQPLNQLGMATAMISDVRGIAAAITDLQQGRTGPLPVQPSAVVEVATPKPTALWQFAQQSLGLPADTRPEAGGDPVSVDMPMVRGINLRVAIRDNALVALTGNAELDAAAGESDTEPNGVMSLRYDYGRIAAAIAEQVPGNAATLPEQEVLEAIDVYYDMRLDITDQGLQMDMDIAPAPED